MLTCIMNKNYSKVAGKPDKNLQPTETLVLRFRHFNNHNPLVANRVTNCGYASAADN